MKRLFPSLPESPIIGDVFQAFPEKIAPLLAYHDALLRGPSDLSVTERELIAAYVSGLNACQFCHGAHSAQSIAFGISPATIEALMANVDTAPIDDKLKPILHYVGKLTRTLTRLTEADAQAVYDAGWSEAALFDAVQTCALFNMMNRLVEGAGVDSYPGDPAVVDKDRLARFRSDTCYTDFGRMLGVTD